MKTYNITAIYQAGNEAAETTDQFTVSQRFYNVLMEGFERDGAKITFNEDHTVVVVKCGDMTSIISENLN